MDRGRCVFDVLVTIMGNHDDEAEILAFARDLERFVIRGHRLGLAVEVRDQRLARIVHQRIAVPAGDPLPLGDE